MTYHSSFFFFLEHHYAFLTYPYDKKCNLCVDEPRPGSLSKLLPLGGGGTGAKSEFEASGSYRAPWRCCQLRSILNYAPKHLLSVSLPSALPKPHISNMSSDLCPVYAPFFSAMVSWAGPFSRSRSVVTLLTRHLFLLWIGLYQCHRVYL